MERHPGGSWLKKRHISATTCGGTRIRRFRYTYYTYSTGAVNRIPHKSDKPRPGSGEIRGGAEDIGADLRHSGMGLRRIRSACFSMDLKMGPGPGPDPEQVQGCASSGGRDRGRPFWCSTAFPVPTRQLGGSPDRPGPELRLRSESRPNLRDSGKYSHRGTRRGRSGPLSGGARPDRMRNPAERDRSGI